MSDLEDLKEALAKRRERMREESNTFPCRRCSLPNNEHSYLTMEEIRKYRGFGSPVTICAELDAIPVLEATEGLQIRCYIHPPPEDPCDEEFMEEISS